jgi:hypothetical protein
MDMIYNIRKACNLGAVDHGAEVTCLGATDHDAGVSYPTLKFFCEEICM